MATIGTGLPTMLDLMKSLDPNGVPARLVEQLERQNPIIEDIPWKEGNLQTGHQFSLRTALPHGTWRKINAGILPAKSMRDQLTETCGMLESLSKVDAAEVEMNGGPAFRDSEDIGHAMGLGNDLEDAFIYASTKTTPEKIHGFMTRLDATAGNPASSQIIKHTGSPSGNDQTSILGIAWGDNLAYGIYPKGTKGGFTRDDMGKQLTDDGSGTGAEFKAWVTHFKWWAGLCIADWRAVVRICNIDTSALSATAFDLVTATITALHRIPEAIRRRGKLIWYANRTVGEFLHQQAQNAVKTAGPLYIKEIGGHPVTMLHGYPVKTAEAILNTEAPVT